MLRKLSSIGLVLFLPFAALVIACSDDDDDDGDGASVPTPATSVEGMEVEQTLRAAVTAYQQGDMTAFLSYWTDEGLQSEFDATRAELLAAGDEFFEGPPLDIRNIGNTEVSGTEATTEGDLAFGTLAQRNRFELVREGGAWKIDGQEDVSATMAIPSGVTAVDVKLDEFSFAVDMTKLTNGNFALNLENIGEQQHELVMFKAPAGFGLQQLLQADPDAPPPAGLEIVGFAGPYDPSDKARAVFTQRLAPGTYMMVCFLPDTSDPAETPHVAKGMAVQFDVTAQGGP
jgi:hypothetical protein